MASSSAVVRPDQQVFYQVQDPATGMYLGKSGFTKRGKVWTMKQHVKTVLRGWLDMIEHNRRPRYGGATPQMLELADVWEKKLFSWKIIEYRFSGGQGVDVSTFLELPSPVST